MLLFGWTEKNSTLYWPQNAATGSWILRSKNLLSSGSNIITSIHIDFGYYGKINEIYKTRLNSKYIITLGFIVGSY